MTDTETKQVINKAWHLLNAFDYTWLKKKDLRIQEYGTGITGKIDYILLKTKTLNNMYYRFDYDVFKGWSFKTFMNKKEAI